MIEIGRDFSQHFFDHLEGEEAFDFKRSGRIFHSNVEKTTDENGKSTNKPKIYFLVDESYKIDKNKYPDRTATDQIFMAVKIFDNSEEGYRMQMVGALPFGNDIYQRDAEGKVMRDTNNKPIRIPDVNLINFKERFKKAYNEMTGTEEKRGNQFSSGITVKGNDVHVYHETSELDFIKNGTVLYADGDKALNKLNLSGRNWTIGIFDGLKMKTLRTTDV
jgi:hypothetical protein